MSRYICTWVLKLWHCNSATWFRSCLEWFHGLNNTKRSCYVTHTYTLYQNSSNGCWVNGTDPWEKHNVCKPCGSIQNSKQECGMKKQSHKQHFWKICNSDDTSLWGSWQLLSVRCFLYHCVDEPEWVAAKLEEFVVWTKDNPHLSIVDDTPQSPQCMQPMKPCTVGSFYNV